MNLTNKVVTKLVHAPVSAGSSDVTDCNVIDTAGYDGVRIIIGFGAITSGAATSVKLKHADAKTSDTALTSGADVAGTSQTVADTADSTVFIIDVYKPAKRYVQAFIARATQNAVVDFAIAELYGARKLPVTQDSTYVSGHEEFASPASGTA